MELFFDLVYVFAVTQLSHYLLSHPSPAGALRTGLLLTMVWLAWAYTTWVTNWLDPERIAVRLLLLALVPASLVMSAAVPDAFGARGLAVGAAYATMQIGRSAFAVVALNGQPLQRNYQRILAWCVVSGVLAILGGLKAGHARELLWVGAVGVDLAGGIVGSTRQDSAVPAPRTGPSKAAISRSAAPPGRFRSVERLREPVLRVGPGAKGGYLHIPMPRIEPAGLDEVTAGVEAQPGKATRAGGAFEFIEQKRAKPLPASPGHHEQPCHLTNAGGQQAQATAADQPLLPVGQQEQSVRERQVIAGLFGQRGVDLLVGRWPLVIPAHQIREVGPERPAPVIRIRRSDRDRDGHTATAHSASISRCVRWILPIGEPVSVHGQKVLRRQHIPSADESDVAQRRCARTCMRRGGGRYAGRRFRECHR